MVLLQIDIKEELDHKLRIYKEVKDFKNKEDTVVSILEEVLNGKIKSR